MVRVGQYHRSINLSPQVAVGTPLTVAAVPTGMNTGVGISP